MVVYGFLHIGICGSARIFERVRFTVLVVAASLSIGACSTHLSQPDRLQVNPVFFSLYDPDHKAEVLAVPDLDILKLSDDMKALVERDVLVFKTNSRRLKALYELVFGEQGLGVKYDASNTKTAVETFESASADCLSFANLFIALARYAGLDAHYQNVEIPLDWDREKDFLVLNKHINVFGVLNPFERFTVDIFPYRVDFQVRAEAVSDRNARAQYFNNKGVEFLSNNDSEQALRYFKRAVLVEPSLAYIWSNTGLVYSHAGYYANAAGFFYKALQLEPDNLSAMSNLASLYDKAGDKQRALYYTEKVKSYRLQNPYYRFALGLRAYNKGDYKQAIKHMKYAVKKKKYESVFYLNLAKAYYRLGLYRKAGENYRKAREMAPADKKKIFKMPLDDLLASG